MDTDRKEERDKSNREAASCSFCAFDLKGGQKEDRHESCTILPRRPLHRESGIVPHLRRRTDCAWRRTSPAGISPTKEPTLKYPEASSRGQRTGPGATRVTRRGLGDGRNPGRTCIPGKEEFPTTRSPASSRTGRTGNKAMSGKSTLRAQPEPRLRLSREHAE
jgi:hypothetical protein